MGIKPSVTKLPAILLLCTVSFPAQEAGSKQKKLTLDLVISNPSKFVPRGLAAWRGTRTASVSHGSSAPARKRLW